MISPGTVALRFETRQTPAGRLAVKVRAVFVEKILDLGAVGQFALVKTGERDRRFFARKHEADSEAVDLRELLPLAWLESLAGSRLCAPPIPKRAA